jgi:hypothetical protein
MHACGHWLDQELAPNNRKLAIAIDAKTLPPGQVKIEVCAKGGIASRAQAARIISPIDESPDFVKGKGINEC